ncbi:MAG TPA: pyridoxamine 5'-phosphate oxidase family protein [Chloroflexota bacterium]
MLTTGFEQVVRSEAELRAIVGEPTERAVNKQIDRLDEHCRSIIAASPFMLLGTASATGWCDVSPKGDAPGFVRVLDERTLAIPDRPGNKRLDSLRNIVQNPRVGLLFVVPGKGETLRVNGRATIVRDEPLLASLAFEGKRPLLAVVVEVEEAFAHCSKAFIRSHLWQPESWPDSSALPSIAQMVMDHARPTDLTLEELEAATAEAYRTKLY